MLVPELKTFSCIILYLSYIYIILLILYTRPPLTEYCRPLFPEQCSNLCRRIGTRLPSPSLPSLSPEPSRFHRQSSKPPAPPLALCPPSPRSPLQPPLPCQHRPPPCSSSSRRRAFSPAAPPWRDGTSARPAPAAVRPKANASASGARGHGSGGATLANDVAWTTMAGDR